MDINLSRQVLEEVAAASSYIEALSKELDRQKRVLPVMSVNEEKIRSLEKEIDVLIEKQIKVLQEINKINNSRIKSALILKYFNNYTWRNVAQKIGMNDTEDSIKKAVERFLNKRERS